MSDAAQVSAVMRDLAARRWRGQVPIRLARELVPRVDELPEIERRALLDALTEHSGPGVIVDMILAGGQRHLEVTHGCSIRLEKSKGGPVGVTPFAGAYAALPPRHQTSSGLKLERNRYVPQHWH
jgi:hypothetical protein